MKNRLRAINHSIAATVVIPAKAGIQDIDLTDLRSSFLKVKEHFVNDSLYRNSIFLMLSTAVQAFIGFFYWIINAHLYSPEQVGLSTTLISVTSLITSFSLLGLNNGLIRYLPKAEDKNKIINTAFTLVAGVSMVFAAIFVFFSPVLSPKLSFLRSNPSFLLMFMVFLGLATLNSISDSVFIAYRSTKYILYYYAAFSLVKMLLPVVFISFGFMGIYLSYIVGVVTALALTYYYLFKRFGYSFALIIDLDILKQVGKFSFGNYVASFLNSLPTLTLPIIITNYLGPTKSAYFYISMMLANFLFVLPYATTNSLFAEGSHSESSMRDHSIKAMKILMLLLLPALFSLEVFGKYILLAFGKKYSIESINLLQVLALSSIFISLNSVMSTNLKIKNKIISMVLVAAANSLLVFFLSSSFIHFGLIGIGYAWLVTQAILSLLYSIALKRA